MAAQAVQLNQNLFRIRLKAVYDAWNTATPNDEYAAIADAGALLILVGEQSDDAPNGKGAAFQTWLLGFEFPLTFTLFEKDKVTFICSQKKARYLNQIKGLDTVVPVEILTTATPKEPPNQSLAQFANLFKAHKRVGSLLKETASGKLVKEWDALTAEKPEMVEIATAVSSFISVKDEDDLKIVRIASNMTSTLLTAYIAPKLENILDKQSNTTHEQFAQQIELRLGAGEEKPPDMKVWSKLRGGGNDIDWASAEFSYAPTIISKSSKTGFSLKLGTESTDDSIAHSGVFLISTGIRYKGYNTNIARTFIVGPDKEQESIYGLLLSLQAEMLTKMKDGAIAREIYIHALEYIKKTKPAVEKNFVKNIGYNIGFELRDNTFLLSPKCTRPLRSDMIFHLFLGFSDLTDQKGKTYAIQLGDTVKIGGEYSILLTDGAKGTEDTLFYDNEVEEQKKTKVSTNGSSRDREKLDAKVVGGKMLRNKTRSATHDEATLSALARMREHQAELHNALHTNGLTKFSEGDGDAGKEGKSWKRFQSYKGEAGLPKDSESGKIFVDRKNQTVLMPIYGFVVPFHINTIKNVSKNDEGDLTFLRINFQTPGQLAGKKEDTPFEDPDATFIRSLSYRSADGHRFDSIHKQITELKKEVNKRELNKKEMADVIEQDVLVEIKGRRPQRLPEVFVRPALDGKRLPGEVEIHQNGLRYVSPVGSHKIDVLFSNIKHLFFQRCDGELLVIIHIHLKAPIIIGKKKSYDVQLYREASDVQFDETGNRKRKHRYGDEDEIEMEQQERKRRSALNKEFKAFADKISEAASASEGEPVDVDAPFRDLSFEGVPHRTNVRLMPTTECLIHLSDPPFLVATLNEIEIASLERVQFSLKQFDLVLVWKDYHKPPLHINSIPSAQLEDVKNWLDSVDIPLSEGPVNLNWGPIMKTINESPYEFFKEGGWTFLGGGGGGEGSDAENSSSSESEFDSEDAASEESSSDGDASNYSASGSDEFDEGSGSGSEDSAGEDWDELEKKAAKSDKKRAEGGRKGSDDSDDDRRKKKSGANGKRR